MLINNIITYLYIERKPEQHEIFRRNLHILESNLWNAIQSEVFRIAWHSQRLCPTGRLFDAGRSETDSGSAGLSAPCLSRRTRSTENLPRGASENKSHAEKKSLKVKQANQNIPVDTLPKWKCASAIGVISLPCHLHLRWYGRFSALSAASNATYRTRRSSTGGL